MEETLATETYVDLAAIPIPNTHDDLVQQLETSVEEHRALLESLQRDLKFEQQKVQGERCLFQDLDLVTDVLQAEPEEEEALPKLSENDLMLALVDLTNEAFTDADQCAQLRLLLETMLNALWESPSNPYVSIENFDTTVVNYLLQSHTAEKHLKDPNLLRLVAFHEPLPDTHAVRPALYR
ncbi:hypothetical protein MYAM1_001681 [Malassezia yamatoensis]|uniref:Uncharacterized protein n=1 Tax=Malassezia yamatoensis TaxID=253288 RepID=A0AAJ5YTH9_9BASI|nr:hypothetical protein MYAM1_001681 [Malassezia yamatoensis]